MNPDSLDFAVFADIRQFVALAQYGRNYDPTDEGSSGAANIFDGVRTTNADIWPGGHDNAGTADGNMIRVKYTKFESGSPGSQFNEGTFGWLSY